VKLNAENFNLILLLITRLSR